MDPEFIPQDLVRCGLCETPIPPMHCDICHINLCNACVVDHLSDESKDHKVVTFNKRGSTINYPKCQKHSKISELLCNHCNVPICSSCVSSGDHDQHKKLDILKEYRNKKELIEKDIRELENSIYRKYEEAAANIPVQKTDVRNHTQKLKTARDKQGEALHTEIDNIIQGMKSEINEMDAQHIAAIDRHENAINHAITEITQVILDLHNLLDSNDVCLVAEYTPRNEEFRSLPVQFQVTLLTFTPSKIQRAQVYEQIGALSKLATTHQARQINKHPAIKRGEQDDPIIKPGAVSSPPAKPLLEDPEEHSSPIKSPGTVTFPPARSFIDVPRLLAEIQTQYGRFHILQSVSCQNDSELWTCGSNSKVRLYNLKGKLLKTIPVRAKSKNCPLDIAVTRSEDLVYTDFEDSSIKLVRGNQTWTLITLRGGWFLRGWRPRGVCSTSSGDLLVIMTSDDGKQTKLVRYTGCTEKHSIQWDDQDKPLYLPNGIKYLCENKNLDICVTDHDAHAVVVVSTAGKFRFRYTGPSKFNPTGITTDSQANILISEVKNHRIHIIDQDGHFLRFIDKHGLRGPWGLCMDSRDNLIVAEKDTGKVKKIQYYK